MVGSGCVRLHVCLLSSHTPADVHLRRALWRANGALGKRGTDFHGRNIRHGFLLRPQRRLDFAANAGHRRSIAGAKIGNRVQIGSSLADMDRWIST